MEKRVEIACHVIEYIPGVYEFLQTSSGIKFAPLNPSQFEFILRVLFFNTLVDFRFLQQVFV